MGSTYRLQLHGLGFAGARRAVPYLARLGIETLYLSPVLRAAPGSTHGYDVADVTELDPVHGTASEFAALLDEAEAHGLGVLLDVVPNHMAATPANPWWNDVLARGRGSSHATVFDIDWEAQDGRVLLAVLGAPLAEVMAAGGLEVVESDGGPQLALGELRLPLRRAGRDAGRAGAAASLLSAQHYRLAYWRLGRWQGNYRRFFDVDGLVGVRVEDAEVFDRTHRLVLELAADPRVVGLRVDHVDGLADPEAYLRRLSERVAAGSPTVVLVEKILAPGEALPARWAADGTTGYEFAALCGGLFVDPAGAAALAEAGAAACGGDPDFGQLAVAARREIVALLFPGPAASLAARAAAAAESARPGTDLAAEELVPAIAELTARLAVYRTYLGAGPVPAVDRRRLATAAAAAAPALGPEGRRALGVFCDGVLAEDPGGGSDWAEVARRWQQLTGAVAAKAVEDTAFWRFDGLSGTAEVGADPADPAVGPERFHRFMVVRARRWPGSLNATTTHDTKRSEDVRARLRVLSELPAAWDAQCDRWARRHRSLRGPADRRGDAPDAHDERLLYQTLLGVWPAGGEAAPGSLVPRVTEAMSKAAREAKRRTSWLDPDEAYESALASFVRRLLAPGRTAFVADMGRWVGRVGPAGATNALAELAVKMTAPGVPDVYQGTELWAPLLVDPDNRRPVDLARREDWLRRLDAAGTGGMDLAALRGAWSDGRLKLWVTAALLRARRSRRTLFAAGSYVPLAVRGPAAAHVVAFARHRRAQWSVTAVPRLTFALAGPGRFALGPRVWEGTTVVLPAGAPSGFTCCLGGGAFSATRRSLPAGELFGVLPAAVLHEA